MVEEELSPIVNSVNEMSDDNSLPKNVRVKLKSIVTLLQDNKDMSIRVNKALQELEDISNDSNIQAYNRTQIWNLISILESI